MDRQDTNSPTLRTRHRLSPDDHARSGNTNGLLRQSPSGDLSVFTNRKSFAFLIDTRTPRLPITSWLRWRTSRPLSTCMDTPCVVWPSGPFSTPPQLPSRGERVLSNLHLYMQHYTSITITIAMFSPATPSRTSRTASLARRTRPSTPTRLRRGAQAATA